MIALLKQHVHELTTIQAINTKLFEQWSHIESDFKLQKIIIDKSNETKSLLNVNNDGKFCDGMYFP